MHNLRILRNIWSEIHPPRKFLQSQMNRYLLPDQKQETLKQLSSLKEGKPIAPIAITKPAVVL
jgi:hypothetical protein